MGLLSENQAENSVCASILYHLASPPVSCIFSFTAKCLLSPSSPIQQQTPVSFHFMLPDRREERNDSGRPSEEGGAAKERASGKRAAGWEPLSKARRHGGNIGNIGIGGMSDKPQSSKYHVWRREKTTSWLDSSRQQNLKWLGKGRRSAADITLPRAHCCARALCLPQNQAPYLNGRRARLRRRAAAAPAMTRNMAGAAGLPRAKRAALRRRRAGFAPRA